MVWKIALVHILLVVGSCKCTIDPCTNFTILEHSKYRGENCISKVGKELCDKRIRHQWYKTENNLALATTFQKQFYCGTAHPIWLNGTLPNMTEGIVNRTACVDYGRDHCEEKLPVMIKNCNGSYAYFLTSPTACPAAYCFGVSQSCPPLEPCDFYYHDELEDHRRSPQCKTVRGKTLCDGNLDTGWYKLLGKNGETKLPTFCPELNSCGTETPIWMNGTYPTSLEQTVKRKVCVHGVDACCQKTYDIEVKNCTTFLVFNLTKTDNCQEGYCFHDNSLNCSTGGQSAANNLEGYKNSVSVLILLNILQTLLH